MEWDPPQWGLVPAETTVWCATCGTHWVVFSCGLKLATRCVLCLDLLERAPMQATVGRCLLLTGGYLVGATK